LVLATVEDAHSVLATVEDAHSAPSLGRERRGVTFVSRCEGVLVYTARDGVFVGSRVLVGFRHPPNGGPT